MIIRIALFFVVVLVAFFAPWWVLMPFAALYAFRYPAYELVIPSLILDLTLRIETSILDPLPYLYTSAAIALIMLGYAVRPYIALRS